MTHNHNWQKTNEETIHSGFKKLLKKTFKHSNGASTDWEVIDEGPFVCILGVTKDKKVILVKQFRPGPEQILYEMPGGIWEKEEDKLEAAKREFLEETGYTGEFEFVNTTHHNPYSTCKKHNFVAINCVKVQDPDNPEENEKTESIELPLEEFLTKLRKGEIPESETAWAGLDYLKLIK